MTLSQALAMANKLKMYCLCVLEKQVLTPTPKSQVSEIADKVMNFTTKNLKQSSMVSYFNKPRILTNHVF